MTFLIQQTLSKMQTATLVRVEKCTNAGGLSPVGFVDVTPLVSQIDGAGVPTEHVTIYNIPYFRIQGGSNAIILDPQPGDIGMCVFASRDISKVKSTKKKAPPGSFRQYSFSDGMYVGGMLNGTPSQYVQFNASGITIKSPTLVKVEAPAIQLNAPTTTINGDLTVTGNAIISGVGFNTHRHTGVDTGGGTSGGPV